MPAASWMDTGSGHAIIPRIPRASPIGIFVSRATRARRLLQAPIAPRRVVLDDGVRAPPALTRAAETA